LNKAILAVLCTALVACASSPGPAGKPASTVFLNAQVADGTGAALRAANVRITGDRIATIGDFQPAAGEQVIDARGLVLAPGFIDIHNHSDDGLKDDPLAVSQVAQGITSMVLGLDGGSPWPIGPWLDEVRRSPVAPNIAMMVGHATVREEVMKEDYRRVARPEEVAQMARLVERAMNEGAIGVSSGVEYYVASYSDTRELVEVAKAAAKHGGFYMTHIRDEADKAFAALAESIAIGEQAPISVQHSHIKLATVNTWNKAPGYIRMIEAARARGVDYLADCYPYDAWSSNLKVTVPDKQYENPESVARAIYDLGGAGRLTITRFEPNRGYEGKTLEQIAQEAGLTPVDMFIRIIREEDASGSSPSVIGQSMVEADIRAFYQQPWVMVSSDGGIGSRHPRGAGAFPRVLGVFVREKQWLSLPEAVRKMTFLPALRLGWQDRGVIREGAYADLVLFNPDTVKDRSTFKEPQLLPAGIEHVYVNGIAVWQGSTATGARPGRVLTGKDRQYQ
jgi:N-acyl-D-amino-acid deacylase